VDVDVDRERRGLGRKMLCIVGFGWFVPISAKSNSETVQCRGKNNDASHIGIVKHYMITSEFFLRRTNEHDASPAMSL
jgi:hypothetical protein